MPKSIQPNLTEEGNEHYPDIDRPKVGLRLPWLGNLGMTTKRVVLMLFPKTVSIKQIKDRVKQSKTGTLYSLSGMKALMMQEAPAMILAKAKGRRRPIRSMVKRMRKAAGNSTRPEIRKSM